MGGTEPSQFYHNLKIAAGEAEGRATALPGTTATSTSGSRPLQAVFAVTGDANLDRRMDEVIGVIARPACRWLLRIPRLDPQPRRRP